MSNLVGDLQQQGEGKLGDSIRTVGGDVADGNSLLFRSLDINYIESCGQHPDILYGRGLRECLLGKRSLVGDDNISVADTGNNILRVSPVIDRQLTQILKSIPAKVTRIKRISVKYYYGVFHKNPPLVAFVGKVVQLGNLSYHNCTMYPLSLLSLRILSLKSTARLPTQQGTRP